MSVKYRFTVWYQNENFKKVGKFMKKFDVEMGELCLIETYELTTSKEKSIQKLKDLFIEAFGTMQCDVFKIEGGKIE